MSKKSGSDNEATARQSCDRCRARKIGCDRLFPSCSMCSRLNLVCVYQETTDKRVDIQTTLADLQSELYNLEPRLFKSIERVEVKIHNPDLHKRILDALRECRFALVPCTECIRANHHCDMVMPVCGPCQGHGHEPCNYETGQPTKSNLARAAKVVKRVISNLKNCIIELEEMEKGAGSSMNNGFVDGNGTIESSRSDSESVKSPFIPIKNEDDSLDEEDLRLCITRRSPSHQSPLDSESTPDCESLPNQEVPLSPVQWTMGSTLTGVAIETNVQHVSDLKSLVEQFKNLRVLRNSMYTDGSTNNDEQIKRSNKSNEFWYVDLWPSSEEKTIFVQEISLTPMMEGYFVELFFATPCCSVIRIPIFNSKSFLAGYRSNTNRPPQVLIDMICAFAARCAALIHTDFDCSFDPSLRPTIEGTTFQQISLALCNRTHTALEDAFDQPNVTTVQTVVMLSYLLLQDDIGSFSSVLLELGMRMAISLELHLLPQSINMDLSPLEQSISWWRLWYEYISQGFYTRGITNFEIGSDAPDIIGLPIEYLEGADLSNDEMMIMNMWSFIIRIMYIFQDIHAFLTHDINYTHLTLDLLSTRLHDWFTSLPLEWREPSASIHEQFRSNNSHHYALRLWFHYFNSMLLLHESDQTLRSFTICLQIAHRINRIAAETVATGHDHYMTYLSLLLSYNIYDKLRSFPGTTPTLVDFANCNMKRLYQTSLSSLTYAHNFNRSWYYVQKMENVWPGVKSFRLVEGIANDDELYDITIMLSKFLD